MRWLRWWRWYLIGVALVILAVTAGATEPVMGYFPAALVLPLWALRVHVDLAPNPPTRLFRYRSDDPWN